MCELLKLHLPSDIFTQYPAKYQQFKQSKNTISNFITSADGLKVAVVYVNNVSLMPQSGVCQLDDYSVDTDLKNYFTRLKHLINLL